MYRQVHHVRRLEKVILCSARLLLIADKKEVAVELAVDGRSKGVAVGEGTILSRVLIPLVTVKTLEGAAAAGAVQSDGI
jgi:hypothetical protein